MRLLALVACLSGLASAKPPPGFQRIESLGIDVQLPDDADLLEFLDWARAVWQGPSGECRVQISIARGDERRWVGTLPITCDVIGTGCVSPCDGLRVVPGGPASERYPTEPARVEIDSAFGDRGEDHLGVLLFSDGTVQFHGARCHGYRGRRGKVPPARVAALVDDLDGMGAFTHHPERDRPRDPQCEHMITHIYLRSASRKNTLSFHCTADSTIAAALALIDRVAGPNPCANRAADSRR